MSKKLQNPAKSHEVPIQIFNPFAASKKYRYTYIPASKDCEDLIDSHWSMHWDLKDGEPFKLELASSPFIAFIFTQYGNFVTGITTGVYGYTIAGKGSLYGTLFRPTKFYELYQRPMHDLTDKELPIETVLPDFSDSFSGALANCSDDGAVIKVIEEAVMSLPRMSDKSDSTLTESIIDYSIKNPNLAVNQIAKHFKISERTLHSLFHDHVGVGIKWIVMRDRLQKAMLIASRSDKKPNWTTVAQELGYSDQPHFINDFKRIVGMSPSRYFKLLARTK